VSTTTEAVKNLIVGVGCRRGTSAGAIVAAVREALESVGCDPASVRLLAQRRHQADEQGLVEAARLLGFPLRVIASDAIRGAACDFEHSQFVEDRVGLPAVARAGGPAGRKRTQLLLHKTILHGVTVAIARENCSSLE